MFSALISFLFGNARRASDLSSSDFGNRESRPRLRMRWERDSENHLISHWSGGSR